MGVRRRLTPEERRGELIDVGAELFASLPYDEVLMDAVAARAEVSRANLYRYFPGKRDLFAAVYRRAADTLLTRAQVDPDGPVLDQVSAGLDAHFDYFLANRQTVLSANRVLAGDPVIQTIISEELSELRRRLLDSVEVPEHGRPAVSAALQAWLVFVRVISVEWLAHNDFSRQELLAICLGSLQGALATAGPVTPP